MKTLNKIRKKHPILTSSLFGICVSLIAIIFASILYYTFTWIIININPICGLIYIIMILGGVIGAMIGVIKTL